LADWVGNGFAGAAAEGLIRSGDDYDLVCFFKEFSENKD